MKAAIYCRVSTEDQYPEKQIAECKQFLINRGYELEGIYTEKISAFKDVKREQYELIKHKAFKGEISAVVVWSLDRWVRNRDTLLEDVTILKNCGCKLHSVKDQWLESVNVEGPIGKTIQVFLLGLIGSLGEMESRRKSERTKMAYNNRDGRWGRKPLPDKVKQEVIELHNQNLSLRKISKQVFYFDNNNNKRNLSLGSVHKIILEFTNRNG